MGGYINIGYKSKSGSVRNALAYTSDLPVFPRCAGFLAGDETRLSELVDRQQLEKDFGPYRSAPYSYGYRFADFQTKTLFDMQRKEFLLSVTWDEMAWSMGHNDGVFPALVPHIRSIKRRRYGGNGEINLRNLEYFDDELKPSQTVEELFDACGFDGFPDMYVFSGLNIDPGEWTMRSFRADAAGAEDFRLALAEVIHLSAEDHTAWDQYIEERREIADF